MGTSRVKLDSATEHLIAEVVDEDLCVQCGTCVGSCPTGALAMVGDNPLPRLAEADACTDCGTCLEVCPRRPIDSDEISRRFLGRAPTPSEPAGVVESFWAGQTTDEETRSCAAAGGIISGLIIHLPTSGEIDGVITCGPDPASPGGIVAKVVTSRAEMLANAGSHYRTIPVNAILQEREIEPGRFALVGTGCHIARIRKLQMRSSRWSRSSRLTIDLMCGMNLCPSWTRYLMWKMRVEDPAEAQVFCYRDAGHAGLGLLLKSGERRELKQTSGFSMFRLAPLFMPTGCSLCPDYYAEHADLSVSDHAFGVSEVYVRSSAGSAALEGAIGRGLLNLRALDVEQGHGVTPYIRLKMRRCQTLLETRRREGLRVPDYGVRENLPDGLWDSPEDKESFLLARRAMREPGMRA